MKVGIFCGGLGVRMGEETKRIPKPMIRIGSQPILWHIMHYYAAWGHREFVICLGHKGDLIKEYLLTYNEALFSDFTLDGTLEGSRVELHTHDVVDWQITLVDTGLNATIGERLKTVEPYLIGEDEFLETYGDGLRDAPLPDVIDTFRASGRLVQFLSVRPEFNAHLVVADDDGTVTRLEDLNRSGVRINGGFFVCRHELLDWIEPGDELVEETFSRLVPRREVGVYRHDGFFGPMDTIKDRQRLEALHETGHAPWRIVGLESTREPAP